ncbi:MAG: MarR family winged helix-turn-helix transcriptional regulator [Sulfurifustaceae bacterium]
MSATSRARRAPSTAQTVEVAPLTCTGATVRRLSRRMTSFYERHLQRVGMTLAQYSLLAHLSEQPQSLLALSRRMEMDRTTLTRNLKPLVADGWAEEVHSDDARQRLYVLTKTGERVRRNAREAWQAAQLALEKQLGSDFVAGLHKQIDRALAKLKPALPEEN